VRVTGDACETCERIFANPVPLVYTRHTARFLSAWLLLLPLGLWEGFGSSWNHLALLPAATVVSIFLFGIEELAVQLEEPFSILPLEALCEEVAVAADAMLEGRASARAPLVEAGRRATPPAQRGGVGPAMLLHAEDAGATLLAAALSATQQQERYFFAGGLCAEPLARPRYADRRREDEAADAA